jgi:hypothetical protein
MCDAKHDLALLRSHVWLDYSMRRAIVDAVTGSARGPSLTASTRDTLKERSVKRSAAETGCKNS